MRITSIIGPGLIATPIANVRTAAIPSITPLPSLNLMGRTLVGTMCTRLR